MITYEDAQNETSDRFADVAKLAKLRRRDLDLQDDLEFHAFASKSESAALASDQLISSAFEVLSLEVQKRAYGHERRLDPALQKHFDTVGNLLDTYVGPGSEKVAVRRAFLREIGPYATAHRNDEPDYDEGAQRLRRLKVAVTYGTTRVLHKLEGRERNVTIAPLSPNISGEQLRHVSDALKDLCEELTKRVRERDYFRASPGRDDVRRFRDPTAVADEIKSTSTTIEEGIARISDPWQKDPLTRVVKAERQRQAKIEEENAKDDFISDALGLTRSVTGELPFTIGLKRRGETSARETSRVGRRRIESSYGSDGRNSANAPLNAGERTGVASRGSAPDELRTVRTGIEPEYDGNRRQALVGPPTSAHRGEDRAPGASVKSNASGRPNRSRDEGYSV